MSTHYIYTKDGVKYMRPVHTREEYLALRNGGSQVEYVKRIRAGEERLKPELVQCIRNG